VIRLRLVVLCSLGAFVFAPVAIVSAGSGSVAASEKPSAAQMENGKSIYRQFCGQCHALKEARAVGFGSAKKKGVGEDGGPAFNQLKISYAMTLASVTMLFGGHEKVVRKMTWKQLREVATWLQIVTRDHPIVAKYSDG
jgi:mono/diheme cytochrome c family protein